MARKWWTLAGTCAGRFLLMLDSTVILVALCLAGARLTWAFVRDADPPRHDPQHRHSHL